MREGPIRKPTKTQLVRPLGDALAERGFGASAGLYFQQFEPGAIAATRFVIDMRSSPSHIGVMPNLLGGLEAVGVLRAFLWGQKVDVGHCVVFLNSLSTLIPKQPGDGYWQVWVPRTGCSPGALADFTDAFDGYAMPYLQRRATKDGLLEWARTPGMSPERWDADKVVLTLVALGYSEEAMERLIPFEDLRRERACPADQDFLQFAARLRALVRDGRVEAVIEEGLRGRLPWRRKS